MAWIDVAAGNLNGPTTRDKDDEVALAFADDTNAIQVLVLGEEWFRNIGPEPMAVYRDPSTLGRGNVKYVAVATGDLDGDGYDNEIVAAFQDGSKNLQAIILKMEGGTGKEGTLKLLWSKSWQDHYRQPDAQNGNAKNARPVDVTTGDIDGDYRDEVIIGFRDGDLNLSSYGTVQLLVLDRQQKRWVLRRQYFHPAQPCRPVLLLSLPAVRVPGSRRPGRRRGGRDSPGLRRGLRLRRESDGPARDLRGGAVQPVGLARADPHSSARATGKSRSGPRASSPPPGRVPFTT